MPIPEASTHTIFRWGARTEGICRQSSPSAASPLSGEYRDRPRGPNRRMVKVMDETRRLASLDLVGHWDFVYDYDEGGYVTGQFLGAQRWHHFAADGRKFIQRRRGGNLVHHLAVRRSGSPTCDGKARPLRPRSSKPSSAEVMISRSQALYHRTRLRPGPLKAPRTWPSTYSSSLWRRSTDTSTGLADVGKGVRRG